MALLNIILPLTLTDGSWYVIDKVHFTRQTDQLTTLDYNILSIGEDY